MQEAISSSPVHTQGYNGDIKPQAPPRSPCQLSVQSADQLIACTASQQVACQTIQRVTCTKDQMNSKDGDQLIASNHVDQLNSSSCKDPLIPNKCEDQLISSNCKEQVITSKGEEQLVTDRCTDQMIPSKCEDPSKCPDNPIASKPVEVLNCFTLLDQLTPCKEQEHDTAEPDTADTDTIDDGHNIRLLEENEKAPAPVIVKKPARNGTLPSSTVGGVKGSAQNGPTAVAAADTAAVAAVAAVAAADKPATTPRASRVPGHKHRIIINLDDKNKFTEEVTV